MVTLMFNLASKISFYRLVGRVIRFNYVSSNDEEQHDEQKIKMPTVFMKEHKVLFQSLKLT